MDPSDKQDDTDLNSTDNGSSTDPPVPSVGCDKQNTCISKTGNDRACSDIDLNSRDNLSSSIPPAASVGSDKQNSSKIGKDGPFGATVLNSTDNVSSGDPSVVFVGSYTNKQDISETGKDRHSGTDLNSTNNVSSTDTSVASVGCDKKDISKTGRDEPCSGTELKSRDDRPCTDPSSLPVDSDKQDTSDTGKGEPCSGADIDSSNVPEDSHTLNIPETFTVDLNIKNTQYTLTADTFKLLEGGFEKDVEDGMVNTPDNRNQQEEETMAKGPGKKNQQNKKTPKNAGDHSKKESKADSSALSKPNEDFKKGSELEKTNEETSQQGTVAGAEGGGAHPQRNSASSRTATGSNDSAHSRPGSSKSKGPAPAPPTQPPSAGTRAPVHRLKNKSVKDGEEGGQGGTFLPDGSKCDSRSTPRGTDHSFLQTPTKAVETDSDLQNAGDKASKLLSAASKENTSEKQNEITRLQTQNVQIHQEKDGKPSAADVIEHNMGKKQVQQNAKGVGASNVDQQLSVSRHNMEKSQHNSGAGQACAQWPAEQLTPALEAENWDAFDNHNLCSKVAELGKNPSEIHIHELVADIFQTNHDLWMKFVFNLAQNKVLIDASSLDMIIILNPQTNDVPYHNAHLILSALDKLFAVFHVENIVEGELNEIIRHTTQNIPALWKMGFCNKHCQRLMVYCKQEERLMYLIHLLQNKYFCLYFPGYIADHLNVLVTNLEKELTFSVACKVSLEMDSYNQRYIKLFTDRKSFPSVMWYIDGVLAKLMFQQRTIDPIFIRSLHQRKIKETYQDEHLTIKFQAPGCRLLLQAWSPLGYQIMIYEGSLEQSDAKVMVLPLSDCENEWPISHQKMLAQAFLDCSLIAEQLKRKRPGFPKHPLLHLMGNGKFSGRSIFVLSVPSVTDTKFKDETCNALENLLKQLEDSCDTLALSTRWSKQSPDEQKYAVLTTKTVVSGLVEVLEKSDFEKPKVIKLYLDLDATFDQEKLLWIDDYLSGQKWSTSGILKTTTVERCVKVVVGKILNETADVLVNSTHPDLDHSKGKVSNLVEQEAGPGLQKECIERYPRGLKEHVVAVTGSHDLQNKFKEIYHISLNVLTDHQMQETKKHGGKRTELSEDELEILRVRVLSCLMMASAKSYQSILFPALGTGVLGYPPDKVAQAMLSTITHFFREMPHSSLQCVHICCYHKDISTVQIFRAEEVFHAYGRHHHGLDDAKEYAQGMWFCIEEEYSLRKSIFGIDHSQANTVIQVVIGDVCLPNAADVVIYSKSQNEDIEKRLKVKSSCLLIEICSKADLKKLDSVFKKNNLASFHFMVETFSSDYWQDLVEKIAKYHIYGQHIVMVVPNENDYDMVCSIVESKWKPKGNPVSVIGAADHNKSAQLQICGLVQHVSIALEELDAEFKSIKQATPSSNGSPVDREMGIADAFKEKKGTIPHTTKIADLFTFSIPVNSWTEDEIQIFMREVKGQYVDAKCKGPPAAVLKFYVTRMNFTSLCTEVHELFCHHEELKKSGSKRDSLGAGAQTQLLKTADVFEEKEIEKSTIQALEILMGTEFSEKFQVKEEGDKTKLRTLCKGQEAKDLMCRIDMLRKEDFPLSAGDLNTLGPAWKSTEEGLEACFIPQPGQDKVSIFTFDYNAMSKAKHLLYVKLGKVKVTARGRRKFDGKSEEGSDGSLNQLSIRGSHSAQPQRLDLKTKSGIDVSIYKCDITKLPVKAIVNAANEDLRHGGGVAFAILKAAGDALDEEGRQYVSKYGPLKVTEVVATTAGNLPCEKVLHAVGPRWLDFDSKQCEKLIADTVYNCLCKADEMSLSSIGIPAISSAIFGVPKDVCSWSYLLGIQKFDKIKGKSSFVRHIHFVDINDEIIEEIQQKFKQNWDTDNCLPDKPSYADKLSPSSTCGYEESKEKLKGTVSSSSGQYERGSEPEKSQAPKKMEYIPSYTILKPSDNSKDFQYKIQFKDLNLLFYCKDTALVKTEAIVAWQVLGQTGQDYISKHFMTQLKPDKKAHTAFVNVLKNLTRVGMIEAVEVGSTLLVLPVIQSQPLLTTDQVQGLVEKSLKQVQTANKKTLAVPMSPQKEFYITSKAVVDFAMGIYEAVRRFSLGTSSSVTEVHVFGSDNNFIQLIGMKILEKIKSEEQIRNLASSSHPSENICSICQTQCTEPKRLNCGHVFCTGCIDVWLSHKPVCPNCNKFQQLLTGDQPVGKMEMHYSKTDIPGFQGRGSFWITYTFQDGTQGARHPSPGKRYSGTSRTAYLPNTQEGRKVLMLLKIAFDRRLVFTIGESATNKGFVGIIWNGIHHKTAMFGGSHGYGYPDDSYLMRVQEELSSKGVTEEDLTYDQKAFIKDPVNNIIREYFDFSFKF